MIDRDTTTLAELRKNILVAVIMLSTVMVIYYIGMVMWL
jgi:hypothetical protein